MKTLYAFLGGFGTKVNGCFGGNAKHLENLHNPPVCKVIDTTASRDTGAQVNKIVIGSANGAARSPIAAEAIARKGLDEHLAGFERVVLIAALGGGTGAGFARYAVEWCCKNGIPVMVVGLANAGDLTAVQNVEDTIKAIRKSALAANVTVPIHYVPDDGSNSIDNLMYVHQVVIQLLDVQGNLLGFDYADQMRWASANNAYPGICELVITADAEDIAGTKCCLVTHGANTPTPAIEGAALRFTGQFESVDIEPIPMFYAHMPATQIGRHIASQREYLASQRKDDVDPLKDLFG